jgi:transposase
VHQAKLTVCVLREEADGELSVALREFGGFKRDRREMARWVASFAPESVVMESTGIYWKSPYAALEQVGLRALVVNARHVKQVLGRKTDLADAQFGDPGTQRLVAREFVVPPKEVARLSWAYPFAGWAPWFPGDPIMEARDARVSGQVPRS